MSLDRRAKIRSLSLAFRRNGKIEGVAQVCDDAGHHVVQGGNLGLGETLQTDVVALREKLASFWNAFQRGLGEREERGATVRGVFSAGDETVSLHPCEHLGHARLFDAGPFNEFLLRTGASVSEGHKDRKLPRGESERFQLNVAPPHQKPPRARDLAAGILGVRIFFRRFRMHRCLYNIYRYLYEI